MKSLIILFSLVITGCDVDECPDSDKIQDGFQQITWQDGSVTFKPIWVCGPKTYQTAPPILTIIE